MIGQGCLEVAVHSVPFPKTRFRHLVSRICHTAC